MDPEWLRLEAERVKLAHQVELMNLRLGKVENRDGEWAERSAGLDEDVALRARLEEKSGILKSGLAERSGRKGKALYLPLRRALTGEDHGPDLKGFLPLIGRDRALKRLLAAASTT